MNAPASHTIAVTPVSTDKIEVRAILSSATPESTPVSLKVNYPIKIVGFTPSLTYLGNRAGLVLPTLDDLDVEIRDKDRKYKYGERFDEGTSSAPNERITLASFRPEAARWDLLAGGTSRIAELSFTFGWKDPATAALVAAPYCRTLVALTLHIERLDRGSVNAG